MRIVKFPVTAATVNADNQYGVGWSLAITGKSTPQTGTQIIQAAFTPKKTITVDGNLSDWSGVPQTSIGNNKFMTAWDANYFYVAATCPGMGSGFPAWSSLGSTNEMVTSKDGKAAGVWLMLGCAANNPDDVLKGHPLYNKGCRLWTDYTFLLNPNSSTPEVLRYTAPGTNLQEAYVSNPALTPPLGGMTSSEVKYSYSDGTFEAAFAWSAVPDLKLVVDKLTAANSSTRINLAWKVEGATTSGEWQDRTGMHTWGMYGWPPYWYPSAICNTPWTFINGDGSGPTRMIDAQPVPASSSAISKP